MRLNRTAAYRSSRAKSGRRNNNEKRKLAPRRLKKAFLQCELNSQVRISFTGRLNENRPSESWRGVEAGAR
jgi:hypothetical protein